MFVLHFLLQHSFLLLQLQRFEREERIFWLLYGLKGLKGCLVDKGVKNGKNVIPIHLYSLFNFFKAVDFGFKYHHTKCPRSLVHFSIMSHSLRMDKTSWTGSNEMNHFCKNVTNM